MRGDDEHFGRLYTRLINIFHFPIYVPLQFTSREDKLTGYSMRKKAKQTHKSGQKEKGKMERSWRKKEGLKKHNNKLIKKPVKWQVHILWRQWNEWESTIHAPSTSPALSVCLCVIATIPGTLESRGFWTQTLHQVKTQKRTLEPRPVSTSAHSCLESWWAKGCPLELMLTA